MCLASSQKEMPQEVSLQGETHINENREVDELFKKVYTKYAATDQTSYLPKLIIYRKVKDAIKTLNTVILPINE